MKRLRRKPMALRTKLFILPIAILLVMSILCAIIMVLEYSAATTLSDSLDSSNHYNQFDIVLSRFRTSFNLYANSFDRIYLRECDDHLNQITACARLMMDDFPNEQIVRENNRLIEQYVVFSRDLIGNSAVLTVTEFWNQVAEGDKLLEQIHESARKVQLLYLQNIADKSDQSLATWETQMQISLVFIVVFLLILLFSINRVIESIISPIMRLVYYAKRISAGDYTYHFEAPSDADVDEISLLTSTFVQMSETISTQMHELQEKISLDERLHTLQLQHVNVQLSLAKKETALMQSMINPHFLFNCLGTVSSMAIIENAPRTQDISAKIARYLRGSMNLVGMHVPIREELKLLQQYIYIQSLRFGDRIRVLIKCTPACEDAFVPALFLQPLIENSFVHGLQGCMQGGKIDVVITQRSQQLQIQITDNGCGIEAAKLNMLRAAIRQPFQDSQNYIGLHSVISQFDMMFKEQYTFEIDSIPGQGMVIRIQLPFRLKDETEPQRIA